MPSFAESLSEQDARDLLAYIRNGSELTRSTKPVDDVALVTRVKNLTRLKMLTDEMKMRAETGSQMGVGEQKMPLFYL